MQELEYILFICHASCMAIGMTMSVSWSVQHIGPAYYSVDCHDIQVPQEMKSTDISDPLTVSLALLVDICVVYSDWFMTKYAKLSLCLNVANKQMLAC